MSSKCHATCLGSRCAAHNGSRVCACCSCLSWVADTIVATHTVRLMDQVMSNSVRDSKEPLGMALFIALLCCIILGSIIYYAERGTWDVSQRAYIAPGTSVIR